MQAFTFDARSVSDTWLEPNTPPASYLIPSYTLLRADRAVKARGGVGGGGGFTVYISQNLCLDHFELTGVYSDLECIL